MRLVTAVLISLGLAASGPFALGRPSPQGPATVGQRAQGATEEPHSPVFEYLGTLRAETGTRTVVENGPQGTRTIVQVVGLIAIVAFAGFSGYVSTIWSPFQRQPILQVPIWSPYYKVTETFAKKATVASYRLDVRLTLKTDDGAMILVTYNGIGQATNVGASLRIAPLFETGDSRYVWLTRLQAVGVGERVGTSVKYDIYALK